MAIKQEFLKHFDKCLTAIVQSRAVQAIILLGFYLHTLIVLAVYLPSFIPGMSLEWVTWVLRVGIALGIVLFAWSGLRLPKDQKQDFYLFCAMSVVWLFFLRQLVIFGFDDFSYRLTAMGFYFQRGSWAPESTGFWWFNLYPKGAESWLVAIRLLLGSDDFLNGSHVFLLTLLSAMGYLCLKTILLPKDWIRSLFLGLISMALIFSIPMAATHLPTVYNDTLVAFFLCASSFYLLKAFWNRSIDLGFLGLSGALVLVIITIKLSGFYFCLWWATVVAGMVLLRFKSERIHIQGLNVKNILMVCASIFGTAIVLIYQKKTYGYFVPPVPTQFTGQQNFSLLESVLSTMGVWNPNPDRDWADFLGRDLTFNSHFLKTFLVLLELVPWNGCRYFYDARFSGHGASFLPLLLFVCFCVFPIRPQSRKLGIGFLVCILFWIFSPYKYHTRYVGLLWCAQYLVQSIVLGCMVLSIRRFKIPDWLFGSLFALCIVFTMAHIKIYYSKNQLYRTHKIKFASSGWSTVQQVLTDQSPQEVCVSERFAFPFVGWKNDFSNQVRILPNEKLMECRFSIYTDTNLIPKDAKVLKELPDLAVSIVSHDR